MTEDDDYLSVDGEPALRGGRFHTDPSERRAAKLEAETDELINIRDSVLNEPALGGTEGAQSYKTWLARRTAQVGTLGIARDTVLIALLAGPLSIVGTILSQSPGSLGALYAFIFAPLVEELMKQAGMILLIERAPYRVSRVWQFPLVALASAIVFSAIENVLYIEVYVPMESLQDPEGFIAYRWTICMLVHILCAQVASLGLIRVWRRHRAESRAPDLQDGYGWFVTAFAMHGLYNFSVTFFFDLQF